MKYLTITTLSAAMIALGSASYAQQTSTAADQSETQAPQSLDIFFTSGRSSVSGAEAAKLDQAARLYRDGNPIVMIVAGHADTVGDPAENLDLSIRRARSVASGLVARGIPISRLQVLGKGNSELPVVTDEGVSNATNRSVNITWR